MRKNIYRAQKVKAMNVKKLAERVENKRIVFGIDVAKEDMYAAFMDETKEILLTVTWKHPQETLFMIDILRSLPCSILKVVIAPISTYGDSLQYQLVKVGIEVYRVNKQKNSEFFQVYQAVPSLYRAKSAAIVARLHLEGMSEVWVEQTYAEKALEAANMVFEMHKETYYRYLNHLEVLLKRHWPELMRDLDLNSVSMLSLLMEYGSPQAVAASPKKARTFLRRVGGGLLDQAEIDGVIASAETTSGEAMSAPKRQTIKKIAGDTLREHTEMKKAKQNVEKLSHEHVPE